MHTGLSHYFFYATAFLLKKMFLLIFWLCYIINPEKILVICLSYRALSWVQKTSGRAHWLAEKQRSYSLFAVWADSAENYWTHTKASAFWRIWAARLSLNILPLGCIAWPWKLSRIPRKCCLGWMSKRFFRRSADYVGFNYWTPIWKI